MCCLNPTDYHKSEEHVDAVHLGPNKLLHGGVEPVDDQEAEASDSKPRNQGTQPH